MLCSHCSSRALMKRPATNEAVCKNCFYFLFEEEVHNTVISDNLFRSGESVTVGISGGKDSACLAEVLHILNQRHNYGINMHLLCIDEGIRGYRDLSLKSVHDLQQRLSLPLTVLSFQDLFGFDLDKAISVSGHSKSCTVCGTLRRKSLLTGARQVGSKKIVLGHNADDCAETVLLNLIRGDTSKLVTCSSSLSGSLETSEVVRVRPFQRTFQKEIVLYCHFKKLPYFSTECLYAHSALRGLTRHALLAMSSLNPRAPLDILKSASLLEPIDPLVIKTEKSLKFICKECGESCNTEK
ncbi:hypothetical protein RCL1_001129 [Eukaryota sp. TZLM3-RCL]